MITGKPQITIWRSDGIVTIYIPTSFVHLFNFNTVRISRAANYLLLSPGTIGDTKVMQGKKETGKRIRCHAAAAEGYFPEWIFNGNPLPLKRYKNGFAIPLAPDGRCTA